MKQLGSGLAVAVMLAALAAAQQGAGEVDLASAEMGGRIESATSELSMPDWAAVNLIAKTRFTGWSAGDPRLPQEIVFSFLGRQAALVSEVRVVPSTGDAAGAAREVEIWMLSTSPADGFTRAGTTMLKPENVEQAIEIAPAEAKFVKVRILSAEPRIINGKPSPTPAVLGKVRIIEGQRAGYAGLLQRNAELAAPAAGTTPQAPAGAGGPQPPAAGLSSCAPPAPPKQPAGRESRRVLVIAHDRRYYAPAAWKVDRRPGNPSKPVDYSLYSRIQFEHVTPPAAAPAHLLAAAGIDTVVLSQVCDTDKSLSPVFKQALVAWVAGGRKLIIQDSDRCGGLALPDNPNRPPDYAWLPYRFKTVNPGAAGMKGEAFLLEHSTLAAGRSEDPAFLDMKAWVGPAGGNLNELGDSNAIFEFDPRWCGVVYGKNALKKSGFIEAYAKFGRGLIIYNGIDYEHVGSPAYEQLVTRELAQPFDPDNLPCTQPLAGFIITTDSAMKSQHMAPGREYRYPLQVLPNFGFTGKVALDAVVVPADGTVTAAIEPASVEVADIATASLRVTTAAGASAASRVIAVRGRDSAGKSNVLCLNLPERTSGSLTVESGLRVDRKPTKNLEIILDASGSMKALLGKRTRWATALDVLKDVVEKLPSDFSVGLRAYGHTLPSTSPKTCTDSALVMPVAPLDRAGLVAAAGRLAPKGETPLVYSILQTPADLNPVGGGTVILITDGEESCKGDFAAAAKSLKDSGLDLTLNIVGFTLKSAQARVQLGGLAESTGGHYYPAASGDSLARAVLLAAVNRLPYRVLDAAGKEVARGDAGAGKAHELPPGEYKVVVAAADQELSAPVTVAVGKDSRVRITIKGDSMVVER